MIVLAAIGVLLGVTIASLFAFGQIGRPIVYRIPGDYRGWLAIRYEDPVCPPLRTDSWYVVIETNSDGRACTSSPVPRGWRYVRYEYVYPTGKRRQLDKNERIERYGATGPQKPQIEVVFVGSEDEQRRAQLMNDVVHDMVKRREK